MPRDPADPAYAWPAELDAAIARGRAARHRRSHSWSRPTPGWANGGRAEIRAPDDPDDFADFLGRRRAPLSGGEALDGLGRAEPQRPLPAQPPDDPVGPRRYAELLDAAYAALKEASPRATS